MYIRRHTILSQDPFWSSLTVWKIANPILDYHPRTWTFVSRFKIPHEHRSLTNTDYSWSRLIIISGFYCWTKKDEQSYCLCKYNWSLMAELSYSTRKAVWTGVTTPYSVVLTATNQCLSSTSSIRWFYWRLYQFRTSSALITPWLYILRFWAQNA